MGAAGSKHHEGARGSGIGGPTLGSHDGPGATKHEEAAMPEEEDVRSGVSTPRPRVQRSLFVGGGSSVPDEDSRSESGGKVGGHRMGKDDGTKAQVPPLELTRAALSSSNES